MAFYSLMFRPGDRILTARAEYAANYVAFLQIARRTGAVIEVIPDDADGVLDPIALEHMIDDRARLIAITWVPTNGGLVNPAAEVGRIARAHNISLRQLYTLCRAADVRIAEWIFEQRLAGARLELQDPRLGSRTIELTARRWGFVDPTHFGRRFKAAYGVSPREFKHLSAA